MEFMALFIWLSLCLVMGAMIHSVMASALSNRLVKLLAAPGMILRKFTMTLAALVCGATVTKVRIYELSSRDIEFKAEGAASIAKVLVPLLPLFGGAVAVVAINSMFGSPFKLDYPPPALAALDPGGLRGFLHGTWLLLSGVVRQAAQSDWGSFNLYVLSALIFSLALGACAPMEGVKEAMLGAALLAVSLALLSSVSVGSGPIRTSPAWVVTTRTFIVSTSGVAFVMMVYGMLAALVVGMTVRIYELATRTRGGRKQTRKGTAPAEDEKRLAA